MNTPNLNLLNEMAAGIYNAEQAFEDSYNAILYKVFESAEFAKGCGGNYSTEQIRKWCNSMNRSHGLEREYIEDIVLEIEARLG